MAIKDLLDKVAKPKDPNDPEVKALREKLARLREGGKLKPKDVEPAPSAPKAVPAKDDELANAPEEIQREMAQNLDRKLKLKEERTHKLMAEQVGELIGMSSDVDARIKKLEQERELQKQNFERIERANNDVKEKMEVIDKRLEKFMGLYEVITNQYNPFAENAGHEFKQLGDDDKKPAVQVSDSLTGEQAKVDIQPGQMSSENMKKIDKLMADLEAQEKKKNELNEDELANVEVKEAEISKDASKEIHALFEIFEKRMKEHVEEAFQEKLHDTLLKLEAVLENEIKAAVKEEVSKLRDSDDDLDSALAELQELEEHSDESFKQAEDDVAEQVRHVDDEIKAVPEGLYFRLADGRILKSKEDLVLALQTMPDAVFNQHVAGNRNDFADWFEIALKDEIGAKLRGKNKQEMVQILQSS